jgi:hypothetical protein
MTERGYFHPDRGYWQTTSDVPDHILATYPEGTVEVPLKPSGNHEWGGLKWVEVLPSPAEALAAWRKTKKLDKAEFVLGLILLEILTIEDALSASRGNWPTALAGFLDLLTLEQSAQVQIEWATSTKIGRNDTYIMVLASYLGLTEAQVDTLFGWTG